MDGSETVSSPLRVLSLTACGDDYTTCLYAALRASGVEVVDAVWSGRWLLREVRSGDIICLHWPSFLYYDQASRLGTWVGLVRFGLVMLLARARGAKIIWIAHNLYPHDGGRDVLAHRIARRIVVALSSWIGVHSEAAAVRVRREFGVREEKLVRLEHGHWIGFYRNEVARGEARRRLALSPDAFVFLFVGLCKPYKNLVHLVRSRREVPDDSLLWIVGKFQSNSYFDEVVAAAAGAERIVVRNMSVANDDMQLYLNACDVVVLPYKEILTSGAAMLAMSFGRPIIAPRLPPLEEVVTSECGLLYDPASRSALAQALCEARERHFDPARIISHAQQFSWDRSARNFVRAVAPGRVRQMAR